MKEEAGESADRIMSSIEDVFDQSLTDEEKDEYEKELNELLES